MAANSSKNHQESSKMSNPRPKETDESDDDDDATATVTVTEEDNGYLLLLPLEDTDPLQRNFLLVQEISVPKGPSTITNDIVLSAARGMTYSLVAKNSLGLNNNRTRGSAGLSATTTRSNDNDNNKRSNSSKRIQDHDGPSNSLEIHSNSLLGNKDDSPPPPKLAKDNLSLNNSGPRTRRQASTNITITGGFNATVTNNDIGSLDDDAPGQSRRGGRGQSQGGPKTRGRGRGKSTGKGRGRDRGRGQRNNNNNVIEKIGNKSGKKRSPVLIYPHITILSSVKEGQPATVQYQCNVCTKKFRTKGHIKYHEFCQNLEKERPFKCESCGQGFITKSHYEYHLRTHTGERPYICDICDKGFNQRGKVTRHMRTHTGEKPFACHICPSRFTNAQALGAHDLIHTGERPYPCKVCNKRFTGMTNLKKHAITHTGERPFECVHCKKCFGLKWTLDLHLRTHSNERPRPHACDQCPRAFSNRKDLNRHLVIHSGERPFKCLICTTTFTRKDNLFRHNKTHEKPRDVTRQLASVAAAEYSASQKKKAPNPATTILLNNQNLNKSSSNQAERNPSSVASSSSASRSICSSSFSISSNHSDSVVNASTDTDPVDIQVVKSDGTAASAVHGTRSLRSAFNTKNILSHLKSTR